MEAGSASDLDLQVARRLKQLRLERSLTLDDLATQSGVSRSMISCIERAESSPTARVLDKLAASLGVSLATLFADEERPDALPLIRRAKQAVWRDPETGYIRRSLSPPGYPSPIDLVEVTLPAKARVVYDSASRTASVHHQVWLMSGAIHVTVGTETYELTVGDCLAFELNSPILYNNLSCDEAHYIVATTTGTGMLR